MPICIECRYPVHQLYTTYSKADDRTLGKGVRLTQCPRCKRFADKYVEHDFVVLFIDLVLIKPQVYRHLLFNRLGRENDKLDPSIIRFGILLLLFDVYLTWARIEKAYPLSEPLPALSDISASHARNASSPAPSSEATLLTTQPILLQYFFFLLLCTCTTLAFHLPIRFLTGNPRLQARLPRSLRALLPPPYAAPNRISTALLVSSCTKLFPILMVVWDYDLPSAARAVSWAVIANNVAALEIVMDCGWAKAIAVTLVGCAVRAVVGWAVLRSAGLDIGKVVQGPGEVGGGWWGWGAVLGLL